MFEILLNIVKQMKKMWILCQKKKPTTMKYASKNEHNPKSDIVCTLNVHLLKKQ